MIHKTVLNYRVRFTYKIIAATATTITTILQLYWEWLQPTPQFNTSFQ